MIDHDRLFKELLSTYFEEFMLSFFPDACEAIDFSHVTFLSEEVVTDVTDGNKYRVDLLAETKLKGEDALIIVHVEPQSYHQDTFNERMFIYFSRLYEKYRRRILPIAVFSYDEIRREPDAFTMSFPFAPVLDFHYLKLELKKQNWRCFIRSDNPAAAALLAKMGYTERERIHVKKEFLRMIVRMDIDPARQTLLTGFFETYLQLTPVEEDQLLNEVKNMPEKEGEKIMEVMVSYERRGLEKGLEKGREQGVEKGIEKGKADVAGNMLKKGMDTELIAEVTGLTKDEVMKLKKELS